MLTPAVTASFRASQDWGLRWSAAMSRPGPALAPVSSAGRPCLRWQLLTNARPGRERAKSALNRFQQGSAAQRNACAHSGPADDGRCRRCCRRGHGHRLPGGQRGIERPGIDPPERPGGHRAAGLRPSHLAAALSRGTPRTVAIVVPPPQFGILIEEWVPFRQKQ